MQDMSVFVSTDRGTTWKHTTNDVGSGNVELVTSIGSTVLAGLGRGGAAVSTDAGRSWTAPLFPLPQDEGGVFFDVLPGVGAWAYAGGAGGIWFSPDGVHWERRAGATGPK